MQAPTATASSGSAHCLAPGKRILHDAELNLDELTKWIDATPRTLGVAAPRVTAAQLVVTLAIRN